MADWAKIKAEYIRGGISTRDLAKKYDVSYSTLRKKCEKEHWVNEIRKKGAKRTQRIVDACATKEANEAIKYYEAADLALDTIKRLMGDPEINAQSIKQLTSALKDIAAVKGLQTEAEKREQEARIAKLRREAEGEERKDTSYRIEFVGNDWDDNTTDQ